MFCVFVCFVGSYPHLPMLVSVCSVAWSTDEDDEDGGEKKMQQAATLAQMCPDVNTDSRTRFYDFRYSVLPKQLSR